MFRRQRRKPNRGDECVCGENSGAHNRDSAPGPPEDRGGYRWGRQVRTGEKLLSACGAGDSVRVLRVVSGGPIRKRLLEMGMNPGTDVRIVKYAPLKDPIECVIRGYHIALRVSEAQCIIVTPLKS